MSDDEEQLNQRISERQICYYSDDSEDYGSDEEGLHEMADSTAPFPLPLFSLAPLHSSHVITFMSHSNVKSSTAHCTDGWNRVFKP
ncbi:hypothetical protein CHARACLAT_002894 [Characodon lateralis]|uniref:Uncharacterized protein n=1 Tax=Characodon lateralis TaxID=208331 RepID=A0ABU7DF20_9TELE|nr:hypothetical protein [Characodon lateralis]